MGRFRVDAACIFTAMAAAMAVSVAVGARIDPTGGAAQLRTPSFDASAVSDAEMLVL